MSGLRRLAPIGLALVTACAASRREKTHAPDSAEAPRIARIEQGLLPVVQVAGEDVRHSIDERMAEYMIAGLGIAVFADYRLLWARSYGGAELGVRVDEDTLFQAGSISKSVHALAVLMAAADGTLALDRPVNEQLTSWKLPDNELTRKTPVTLRHLLSHTAGTTVHGFPGYALGAAVPTVVQILDGVPPANTGAVRVDLAPGTMFRYSGGGTTISQLLLTDRTDRPYPELLAARVLGPLGMTHSTYEQPLPSKRLRHAAAGHDRHTIAIPGGRHTYPEMAAAGLWTTPSDLARFFAEVALARAGRSTRITEEIAGQMTTKVVDVAGRGDLAVGLGVFLMTRNGARFFGHGGADEGFTADALASLDGGYGVIIMTNSDTGHRIFAEIERTVLAEYGWPGADRPIVRFAIPAADRARFVGRYLDGPLPLHITVVGDRLVMREPFDPGDELVPVAADAVVARATGQRIVRGPNDTLEVSLAGQAPRALTRLADADRHPLLELETAGLDAAVALWREQARADPAAALAAESFANTFGYRLLERDPKHAVLILRMIAAAFPDSSNAHDSLGEAYMTTGDKPQAIAEYERAIATLAADPRVPPADRAARRTHAEERLARLRARVVPGSP